MEELKPITKRLDVLIRLILEQQLAEGKMKRKNQLILMDSAGLSTGEISVILGQSSKDVSSQLIKLKRKGKKNEQQDNNEQ